MSLELRNNAHIELDGISIEVIRKNIRNIHLRVYPRTGIARISAPHRMNFDDIKSFAAAKRNWIRNHLQKIQEQSHIPPLEFIDGEGHYLWGRRLELKVMEKKSAPTVEVYPDQIVLQIRPVSERTTRKAILYAWYRNSVMEAAPALVKKWEPLMGVKVKKIHVQKMKTRWGSCNTRSRQIRLNSELARKPQECLEYVIVHEMVHLLEPSHNQRFYALMGHYLPQWKHYKQILNNFPDKHGAMEY